MLRKILFTAFLLQTFSPKIIQSHFYTYNGETVLIFKTDLFLGLGNFIKDIDCMFNPNKPSVIYTKTAGELQIDEKFRSQLSQVFKQNNKNLDFGKFFV